MKVMQDKASGHDEGNDRDDIPPTRQDVRPCGKYDWSTTPPIKQTGEASNGYDGKLGQNAVADDPALSKQVEKAQGMMSLELG